MSTPAPLLRPPIPGARSHSSPRAPRLGLSIPPSPNARPVVNGATAAEVPAMPSLQPQQQPLHARPTPPPMLRLATPSGSQATPQENAPRRGVGGLKLDVGGGFSAASSGSDRSRSNSGETGFTPGRPPLQLVTNSHDPLSALSSNSPNPNSNSSTEMQRTPSGMSELVVDLEKLKFEKGGQLEPGDLDDAGWRAASKEELIEELGSLGEGAGGAVTRCKLKGGRTVFALKIITSNPDPSIKRQIVRELSFNASLQHPSICRYYGAFQPPSNTSVINIAMEFCEGGSLDSVYREVLGRGGRIGEKVLGVVARGVLEGLTYLHSQRIIHRDIKPSNILLSRAPSNPDGSRQSGRGSRLNAWEGIVKLCDFGVSGEFGTKGMAETFIGTSYYMAPERIQGMSYTITSDVWSLGVTLLEVAQARFPFPADAEDGGEGGGAIKPQHGLIDLLTYIVMQPIPKLKDEPKNNIFWGEKFKYFIECCLEKDATKRATPWRMMEHPWMVEMKTKKVNMELFLSQVWEWKD
ncbi:MAP kinase [Phyllosticta citricarpa]|uniref:MAP kinase n=2 Tax=Phyllosticta TaxID=121621 RepID=A0ABR1MG96_9PEZI